MRSSSGKASATAVARDRRRNVDPRQRALSLSAAVQNENGLGDGAGEDLRKTLPSHHNAIGREQDVEPSAAAAVWGDPPSRVEPFARRERGVVTCEWAGWGRRAKWEGRESRGENWAGGQSTGRRDRRVIGVRARTRAVFARPHVGSWLSIVTRTVAKDHDSKTGARNLNEMSEIDALEAACRRAARMWGADVVERFEFPTSVPRREVAKRVLVEVGGVPREQTARFATFPTATAGFVEAKTFVDDAAMRSFTAMRFPRPPSQHSLEFSKVPWTVVALALDLYAPLPSALPSQGVGVTKDFLMNFEQLVEWNDVVVIRAWIGRFDAERERWATVDFDVVGLGNDPRDMVVKSVHVRGSTTLAYVRKGQHALTDAFGMRAVHRRLAQACEDEERRGVPRDVGRMWERPADTVEVDLRQGAATFSRESEGHVGVAYGGAIIVAGMVAAAKSRGRPESDISFVQTMFAAPIGVDQAVPVRLAREDGVNGVGVAEEVVRVGLGRRARDAGVADANNDGGDAASAAAVTRVGFVSKRSDGAKL